jgi:hypothetical protein
MIKFLLNIFSGSLLKLNETKKIIGYFEANENGNDMIKDKDCQKFLVNCSKRLEGLNYEIYETNKKMLSSEDDRNANINKKLSSEIANKFDKYKKNKLYKEIVNGIMQYL